MSTSKILVVDDDPLSAELLCDLLGRRGMAADAVTSGQACLDRLADHPADIVLTDLRMPGLSGTDLVARLRDAFPEVVSIVFTGRAELDAAVESIRAGAFDFLTKPVALEALAISIGRAIEHLALRREVRRLRTIEKRELDAMLGTSAAVRETFALVERFAKSDATVLITGESGTGKELVARALHARSAHREHPFLPVNCAAIPGPLLESELFGHVRGAFTDAHESRAGLFAQAGAGTVFLDEIGEMPLEMQAKLLRVLQERTIRPVGGDHEVAVRGRVIAATNRDLEAEVEQGRFREDLYYRINVVNVAVPPLRARGGDVLLLAQAFLERSAVRNRKAVDGLSPPAARALMDYDWPGNVRELENCMERAVASCRLSEITLDDLPQRVQAPAGTLVVAPASRSEMTTLDEMERRYVQYVLGVYNGNKTHAARALGIDRRSLYRRIAQWHLGDTPEAVIEE